MNTHLPSSYLLSAKGLATFERLFRVRSINKVAEQMHMSPPAVSYQINTLESLLGQKLFQRSARGVEPTAFAESIYFDTTVALEHMRNIVRRSRDRQRRPAVRILVTQAMASLWLLPKVPDLLKHFPNVQFEIISWKGGFNHEIGELEQQNFDFEFRYARREELTQPKLARQISPDMAIAVCSPEYQERLQLGKSPEAWSQATVLHARNWPGIWERWCEAAFQHKIEVKDALHFQGTSLCVQAALSGIGLAIVHAPLVSEDLRTHRLVSPHPYSLPVEEAYFALLGDPATPHAELFDGFVAWCHAHMNPLEIPSAINTGAKNDGSWPER